MRVRRIFVRVDLGLEGLEFGFDLGFVAFGTDAVAECHVSAGFDIAFDLLPVILVVAYLFAVGADRQKPLQVLLAFDRCLQGAHSVRQRNLQVENAFAYLDSGLHFFAVEGFVEIIIGASLQCFGNIVFGVAGREYDDVEMLELCILARLATGFDPVELGHHPIENRQTRGVFGQQGVIGLLAVGRGYDLVAPCLRVVCNSSREVASSSAIRIFIGMLLLTRLG